jgi:hypothetical protein
MIGHYERDGEIKIRGNALDSPSEREIARQERMKREGWRFCEGFDPLSTTIESEVEGARLTIDSGSIVSASIAGCRARSAPSFTRLPPRNANL